MVRQHQVEATRTARPGPGAPSGRAAVEHVIEQVLRAGDRKLTEDRAVDQPDGLGADGDLRRDRAVVTDDRETVALHHHGGWRAQGSKTVPLPSPAMLDPGSPSTLPLVRDFPTRPGRQSGTRRVRTWDRILDTAYDLFSQHGVRAVGVDRIVAESGVAKISLYRHFPSKDDLVLTFLQERERRWTNEWLRAESERRGDTAAERLLAIFDVFGEWFVEDFEGCSFINMLLEFDDREHRVHQATVEHLKEIRAFLRELHGRGRRRGPRRARPPVAHPHEGVDRRRRRGRPDRGRARPPDRRAAARARGDRV